MQDVILLVTTSAIFIFGYFLMNKLDVFLENNWNRQETALTYGENSLRIGFSNPLIFRDFQQNFRKTSRGRGEITAPAAPAAGAGPSQTPPRTRGRWGPAGWPEYRPG